ncbi:hypothetical protein EMCRGX_G012108 [Ephydatia muelleri]
MEDKWSSKWSIDKLTEENWSTWKFQTSTVLKAKKLWAFVDGDSATLPADASADQRARYAEQSDQAMAVLVMAISQSLLHLVTDCKTPREIWKALKDRFERNGLTSKMLLMREFLTFRLNQGHSVNDHLKRFKEICDKLSAIEQGVTEEQKVMILLLSLPKSWDGLQTALMARGDDLTLSFVQQALLSEELKRQHLGEGDCDDDLAFHGTFRGECFNCGEKGHKSFECRKPKQEDSYGNGQSSFSTSRGKGKGRGQVRGGLAGRGRRQLSKTEEARIVEDDDGGDSESSQAGKMFVVGLLVKGLEKSVWIIDSGASRHMTFEKSWFVNYTIFRTVQKVGTANGDSIEALGYGDIVIQTHLEKGVDEFIVKDVLYVPDLTCSLLSVSTLLEKGKEVRFLGKRFTILDHKGKICGQGQRKGRLFFLDGQVMIPKEQAGTVEETLVSNAKVQTDLNLWHQRLGHVNEYQLRQAIKRNQLHGVEISDKDSLKFCVGWVKVYFLRKKSETMEKFKEFEAEVSNQWESQIQILRTDGGGEYISKEFKDFLKLKGIHHEMTVRDTPEQNGVAERMNRTLCESGRAMLFHAELSKGFWAEAINTAVYIRNRLITSATGETPYFRCFGEAADVSHLRVFGCMAFAHVPDDKRQKFDKKAWKLRFVGYADNQKGYRLWDSEKRRCIVLKDVIFNENEFDKVSSFDLHEFEEKIDKTEKVQEDVNPGSEQKEMDQSEQEEQPVTIPPPSAPLRKTTRSTAGIPPIRFTDEFGDFSNVAHHFAFSLMDIYEPTTLQEAMETSDSDHWWEAAQTEYNSLYVGIGSFTRGKKNNFMQMGIQSKTR